MKPNCHPRLASPGRRLLATLGVLCAALVLAGCTGASAKDRGWTIADPLWSPLPQTRSQAEVARARAVAIAHALGIPGDPSAVRRERDMMYGLDYDLVEFTSAAGDRAEMRLDPETHGPLSIVRLGAPDPSEPQIVNSANAPGRARAVASMLGLPVPDGTPAATWDDAFGAWSVTWTRTIDGKVAEGDGVTIDLTPGGTVKAVTSRVTPSAPVPANAISADRAAELARGIATERGWTGKPRYTQDQPEMVWVRGNNFWDPARSDTREPLLKLAWSVHFSFIAVEGDEPHQVILWFSAADGSILGGDQTA